MSSSAGYSRKNPADRREEILSAAAAIALQDGLERITVRAVAERIGVRPGLISHYFPVVQDLVVAAFERAAAGERGDVLPDEGEPLQRMAQVVAFFGSEASADLSRLWLNARHLSRFTPALADAVGRQESAYLERLTEIVAEGAARGDFVVADAEAAAVRILMAVDAATAYVNDPVGLERPGYTSFLPDVTAWSLGLPAGVWKQR